MSNPPPPVADVMRCPLGDDGCCSSSTVGHTVSAIRERVAAATPSRWRDGIVSHATSGNWIGVALLGSPDTTWLWNHGDLGAVAPVGEPVALHDLYDTLAIGTTRVNVLRFPR